MKHSYLGLKNILAAALVAFFLLQPSSPSALSQTKGETSQYTKLLKKPTAKLADKFLKKFPSSLYAPKVARLRDSLLLCAVDHGNTDALRAFVREHPDTPFKEDILSLIRSHNTSSITRGEALLKAPCASDAIGWKVDNREGISALYISSKEIKLRFLDPQGGELSSKDIPIYTSSPEGLTPSRQVLPLDIVTLGSGEGRGCLHFAYLNEKEGAKEKEWVEVLYDPSLDLPTSAMFYGKALPSEEEEGSVRIEGQCAESIGGVALTPEVSYLVGRISDNPSLVPISRGDLLTDEAIKWWLGKNPNAETSATSLVFGALDRESTLVEKYEATRKENAGLFRAAMFDYRDYTLVVAYSKKTDDYLLVWCEGVCVDRKTDKLLNSIYFEDDSTLDLFYYHGRKTFKLRINLASKRIRR